MIMKPVSFYLLVLLFIGLSLTDADQTDSDVKIDTKEEKWTVPAVAESNMQRKNSRMPGEARDFSSIVQKLTNYISSYTSATATWLQYPYYGISTGVAITIVIFVAIFILIIVSGTVVTTGRSLADHMGVDYEELDRLTHIVMKAVDMLTDKLGDSATKDQDDSMARKWGAGGALPSWSSTVTQVDSVSEYISENLYDKLIWLSKPYAGNIMTLGSLILYMVVIVGITMTNGIFPVITPSGRQLNGQESDVNLGRTAENVMKAIKWWDAFHHTMNDE